MGLANVAYCPQRTYVVTFRSTEKWGVLYNNNGGWVDLIAQSNASPAPEPASLLLLGTGLLALMGAAKSKGFGGSNR